MEQLNCLEKNQRTFLIKGASCLLPDLNSPFGLKQEITDVFIEGGLIRAFGSDATQQYQQYHKEASLPPQPSQIIQAKGLSLLPGIIDTQVHFRDPGLTHKEDFFHGSQGAILGGVTTVFDMPNTQPPTTTLESLQQKMNIALEKSWCHFAFFVGASKDNVSVLPQLEMEKVCCGLKIFMGSSTGSLLVHEEEVLESILSKTKKICAVHSEDEHRLQERKQLFRERANLTAHFHPEWRDVKSALISTKKIIGLAQKHQRRVHVLHISTEEEMELLKDKKPLISCEVLPQHLTLYAPDCYDRLGSFAQMNPPLREKRHQDALWKALQKGWIDVIGSDHAPHTLEEKQAPYPQSPSGLVGVQTLLPIMLYHVQQGRLSLEQMVFMMSCKPAQMYQIPNKGSLQVGFDADLTLVDLKQKRLIEKKWIVCKSPWTPYEGMEVQGWPVATFIQGQLAMYEDEVLAPKPCGKPILFSSKD